MKIIKLKHRVVIINWFEESLLDIFSGSYDEDGKNYRFTFLPMDPHRHIYFFNSPFGINNRRLDLGMGILSLSFDY